MDTFDNYDLGDDPKQNPAELFTSSEEKEELHKSIGKLPEKVGMIIRLHYFDGLSIAEIADRMRISEGTVKWQLHDGRKRIRKDLCAMDEKYDDTLVRRVMKKVEELKLWRLRNDKTGFDAVYRDVLREVEELPESNDKNHALADVLTCGWWWLPGDKNDELFARISDAAMNGKNEDAMTFIVTREDSKLGWNDYGAKIEFIRDKQIPKLEKAGFRQTLGREWFWLGYFYFRSEKPNEGREAYEKVRELLGSSDAYYNFVPYALEVEKLLAGEYKDKKPNRYIANFYSQEYRCTGGSLRFWNDECCGEGYMQSIDRDIGRIFRNACLCDGMFFVDIKTGESFTGSDGSTLTFSSDNETVQTPAGRFDGCQSWTTVNTDWSGKSVWRSYYKEGVGIVKQEHYDGGILEARLLSDYHIEGGSGFLPFAAGNTWEYMTEYPSDVMKAELKFTVSYADGKKVMLTSWENAERLKYDENSWLDMIQQIRNDYFDNDSGKVCDVSKACDRAEALAETSMEKAHTKAAVSVARRIMDTDQVFNPNCTATGHWNFFNKSTIQNKNGLVSISYNPRWSFELKSCNDNSPEASLPYNDIYGILQDAVNCIWSDEWMIGAVPTVEYPRYEYNVKTKIICEDGGTIATKAGEFVNCLKLSLDIGGMTGGWSYRGGKKVYYFAEGIGIVRTENEYSGGAKTAVYELTSYTGTGKGYMPMEDSMIRRYDALDLTDGCVGAAEYTYVADITPDSGGGICIFNDRTGIRVLPPPITYYGAIQDEMREEPLWDAGKHSECRSLHDVNNYKLMLHFLCRDCWNLGAPQRNAFWHKYKLSLIDTFRENGELPLGWLGLYADTNFLAACTLFGCDTPNEKEEGYEYLEKAFELYERWLSIPDGELLETGNHDLFGGLKLKKGSGIIILPDGTLDAVPYEWRLNFVTRGRMYAGMTALHGWEWFNPVRGEERFKEYVARAKTLLEE